ncbi:MAG: periplasmic protein CpxP/Spy [Acidobacteriota bacterium]|jgi:Spy/CpxP family protein refolding chaperone|nr:periplasmic protein CpxP/Spy [Acidobacteriota bacterium]
MKHIFTKRTAATGAMLFVLLLAVSSRQVLAQNPVDAPQGEQAQGNQDSDWRTALNLTPDQMAKIRSIREQNKADGQLIRRRVNQAQRALDQAIYSDNVNEAEIDQRAHELAEAQAAEVRMRATTELNIRRVLTPEQLNTFRTIRLERMRDAQMKRRQEKGNTQEPLRNRRLENGINQTPRNGDESRPAGAGQGGRNLNPALGPKERRNGLPRRIRP